MAGPGERLELFRENGVASTPGIIRFVDGGLEATLAECVVGTARLLPFVRDEDGRNQGG